MTLKENIEGFIKVNRRIIWEAEYQEGECCVGENQLRQFISKLESEHKHEAEPVTDSNDLVEQAREYQSGVYTTTDMTPHLIKFALSLKPIWQQEAWDAAKETISENSFDPNNRFYYVDKYKSINDWRKRK